MLQPLLLGPARNNQLKKPLLIIAVTDGAPGGEDRNTLVRVLVNASRFLKQTRYGPDAMSVQLAQIGNDLKARAFLEEIDSHAEVGDLVDCTSLSPPFSLFVFSLSFRAVSLSLCVCSAPERAHGIDTVEGARGS